jgi:hypothetical protein
MTKILAIAALLSIMAISPSWGDIYKCQFPDGRTFFTDSPRLATDDCKLERVNSLPILGILSDAPSSRTSVAPNTAQATSSGAGENEAKSYETFKNEVLALVEQFQYTRRGTMRGLTAKKLKARRELTDIRAKKASLAYEIEQSPLSRTEMQELRGLLAEITESAIKSP